MWCISLFTNLNLAIVVFISFGLQVWSHHNAFLGRFLKTSSMPISECLVLLALGAIPLLVLEMVKIIRSRQRRILLPQKTDVSVGRTRCGIK